MSFDNPECFHREEQIWNKVFNFACSVLRVKIKNKKTPFIENKTIANKDVEETFVFPKETTAFEIRDRGSSRMKFAYSPGQVEGGANKKFLDRGPHSIYKEDGLNLFDELTIYFSSDRNSRTIEIVYWI